MKRAFQVILLLLIPLVILTGCSLIKGADSAEEDDSNSAVTTIYQQ